MQKLVPQKFFKTISFFETQFHSIVIFIAKAFSVETGGSKGVRSINSQDNLHMMNGRLLSTITYFLKRCMSHVFGHP